MGKWIEQSIGSLIVEEKKSAIQVQGASNFGDYPFFTSGDNVLVHDEYLVDGEKLFLATGGKANIKFYNGKSAYSTDTYVISSEKASTQYLYFFLLNQIEFINSNLFTGSGLKHLQKNDFKKLKFELPEDKPEQSRIARILSKADAAIAQTEALIAKYQRIKTGLMQDLLTKGIDEHGNIRSKATHRFVMKNGIEVPEEWEVCYLEKYVKIQGGNSFKSDDFAIEGIQLIRIGNLYNNILDLNRDPIFLPYSFKERFKNFLLSEGDIVMSMTGTYGKRDYGFAIMMPSDTDYLLNQRVCRFSYSSNIDKDFLLLLLRSEDYLEQLFKNVTGSKQANLNTDNILKIWVRLPDEKEQKMISQKINSIDKYIQSQQTQLHKFQALKTGLMQDLLSGKVRVYVYENEIV